MVLPQLLDRALARTPNATALLAPSRAPLSYALLDRQIAVTVGALRAADIGPQDCIAVALPNGPELAVAICAAASGAVCAPLNPGYTIDDFRFHLTHLHAKGLLLRADDSGPVRIAARALGVRCLDVRWHHDRPAGCFDLIGFEGCTDHAWRTSPRSDDVALVLPTSGTTSRPKIVPLSHANLCCSAANVARTLGLSPEDRCLGIMPLFHVHGIVAALLSSLAAGGSIACTSTYRDGRFASWLAELRPTWITAVPSMYQAILGELSRHSPPVSRGLRFVRSSSAPLPKAVMRELERVLQVPVIEAYGMTEAAHQVASNPLPPRPRKPTSVGIAAGPDVAVMDDVGGLLPPGATGEIVIRGQNVMRGYASDPEANAKAFSAGWFRTGDLGHIDADGYVFLEGRLNEIINRGGENISPREIDDALLEHPSVVQAVAFAVPHETLGEDIAAAVVLKPGESAPEGEIRGFLFGRLAEFKIPRQLLIVDSIPTGTTGKIQRKGLKSQLAQFIKPAFVAPRDAIEAQIADIFTQVLGARDVGALDNFFSLGGDSLRGTQALARVADRFGTELSIRDLFRSPTVAELAKRISDARAAAEREALLVQWNDTGAGYPRERCIHQLFEQQVARTPEAIAAVFEQAQLTYAELNARANQLAHHLIALGVGPDVPVGLCLARSLDLVVGMLAILKAGGAYVPLDPSYPAPRLAFMIADAQAPVLLTQASLIGQLPPFSGRVVSLDCDWAQIAIQPQQDPPPRVHAEHLAYVIYTSGSTGQPKGVMMGHRPICNLAWWQIRTSAMPVGARTLQLAPVAFDVSVQEMFSTLCAGGTLVLIAERLRRDPSELLDVIETASVARLFLTFSALQQLAETAVGQQRTPNVLREVITAGEQLRITPAIGRWLDSLPDCRLCNQYGPTETHVVVTHSTLAGRAASWPALPPIGRPISNVRIYLLGDDLRPVAPGAPGEIVIGGDCLARGYLNRPELTAERFMTDPFSADAGARMYRSGDFGKLRDDGNIEFLGRRDDQIKLRGFRIEIGEVEAALDQHPDIVRTTVAVYEPDPGDRRLVAYFEGRGNRTLDADVLRAYLLGKLPEHMVPATFVQLAALPMSPTGKIDRRALPEPTRARPPMSSAYVEPSTPLGQWLLKTWQELLGLAEIGADDDFFVLGGDSLKAARLIGRIRSELSRLVPYRALVSNSTIDRLARLLEQTPEERDTTQGGVEPDAARRAATPATPEQQAIWLAASPRPDLPIYNECFAIHLNERVDRNVLQSALNALVGRHDVLRTGFVVEGGQVVQQVAPAARLSLKVVDAARIPPGDAWATAIRAAESVARQVFDPAQPPLVNALLALLPEAGDVLFITMHHLVIDAFGFYHVFVPELAALYERESGKDRAAELHPLAIQFADFARWQARGNAQSESRLREFWKTQLAEFAPLELPVDRTPPPIRSYRGEFLTFSVAQRTVIALRRLAARERTTLFAALVAAFNVLLHRYTGQQDIAIRTVDAGRVHPQHETLLGCCVRSFVLRASLEANPTFRQLARRVAETLASSLEHVAFPFREMLELSPSHASGQGAPVPVAFVLEPSMPNVARGWSVSQHDVRTGTAKFDLTFEVEERVSGLIGRVEYATDLFDRDRIERMVEHWRNLLEGIVAAPDTPIAELPLLTAAEQRQLKAWNDTATVYPRGRCIHELFEEQAARTPDAIAAVFEQTQLTYAELNARANRLAHHLIDLGVDPDVPVGLCLTRSLDLLVGLLGILKAGGAYVPLDPSYPAPRLGFMLADTQAPVLLTQEPLLGQLPPYAGRLVCLDRDWFQIATQPPHDPPPRARAEHLAYVIYTSGSTGQPKGVAVMHRNVVRLVCNSDYVRLDAGDCVAQASTASFDAATFEIWGALLNGARIAIVARDAVLDPARLVDALRQHRVSTLFVTTALFNAVVRARSDAFAGLKQLLFGGEAADARPVRECLDAGPPRRLLHVYGPTETTTFATWYLVDTVAPDARTLAIGRPIANTTIHLLDQHRQPVPIGVAGELYIGGDGVARGYFNRPELTAERFVPDAFAAQPGARLYRTGDRARYRPDGTLEFLGRLDQQIKLRGFRIEPGEIEALLLQQPAVEAALVMLREDRPGEPKLVAYVVARGDAPEDLDLRGALRQHLPDYMVPATFVRLPALPLNPNGKIDRAALPAPEHRDGLLRYRAAQTPTQKAIANLWADLLHRHQVGLDDNFFDLGGHSLLAVQLMARLRDAFGVELPVRALFESSTVVEQARLIERTRRDTGERSLEEILESIEQMSDQEAVDQPLADPRSAGVALAPRMTVVSRKKPLPLSFAQQRLWFLERLTSAGAAYNIVQALRLEGALDRSALEASLNAVIARHDALRTTFAEHAGNPVQVVATSLQLTLAAEDVEALPKALREDEVRRRAQEEAATPFSLERGPLVRARLFRLGEPVHVLVLVIHHMVADGWSMGVLLRQLAALYRAFVRDEPPALEPLPLQYADYAAWQRQWLQGGTLARQLDYWTKKLTGAPALHFPTDGTQGVQRFSGARRRLHIAATLTGTLQRLSQNEGATLFMTLLAAFQLLLSRHSGQDDIVVGVPVAGRMHRETECLIGFFVNALALRTDVSGNPRFWELLRRVREVCLGAYTHQELPFEKVVEVLNPARELDRNPLFDVMVNHIEPYEQALKLDGLRCQSIPLDAPFSKFAMTLYICASASGIALDLVYQNALFSAERMEELLQQYHDLLTQIAESPDRAVLDYSLVTSAARARLPDPTVVIDAPPYAPVVGLFTGWAERDPDAIAVTQGARQWNYRALAEAGNRIAHALRYAGIGCGDVVAIVGSRSFGLISGMLGVWLAGGAFLVVDSALPETRRELMVREARAIAICRIGGTAPPDDGWKTPASVRIFDIDPDGGSIEARTDIASPLGVTLAKSNGDDAAYVFFTSGTTGVPKAVLGCHRGLAHFLDWQRRTFGIGPSDRVAQLTSLTFDVLLRDVFLPLTSGGTLCIPEDIDHLHPLAWLARERVTVVHTVPTLLSSWLANDALDGDLPALRWLCLSGEPLSGTLVRAFRERFPGCGEIVNLYGPTETTLVKCFHRVADEVPSGPQPAGMALPETQALVLNAARQPCGIGELGEVVIRTPFRTLGYINAPQDMRTHFVPNPFREADESDLLYFTGDRGRYRPDGSLDILGRLDDQLKIRGVRVEPGEVTAALQEHPAVRMCVALGRRDARGIDFLAAYVVVVPERNVTVAELRAFVTKRLPAALVPSRWHFLDDLPRLPNGKVNRSALRTPAEDACDRTVTHVPPRTPIESRLACIWQDILGVASVGMHDNFFDAGGHSLKATQLVSRIDRDFGVTLPLREIFEAPTIAEQGAIVGRLSRESYESR